MGLHREKCIGISGLKASGRQVWVVRVQWGSMGFGVQGVEVRIQGVCCKACGVGFGVDSLGYRVGGYTGMMGNTTETTVL